MENGFEPGASKKVIDVTFRQKTYSNSLHASSNTYNTACEIFASRVDYRHLENVLEELSHRFVTSIQRCFVLCCCLIKIVYPSLS